MSLQYGYSSQHVQRFHGQSTYHVPVAWIQVPALHSWVAIEEVHRELAEVFLRDGLTLCLQSQHNLWEFTHKFIWHFILFKNTDLLWKEIWNPNTKLKQPIHYIYKLKFTIPNQIFYMQLFWWNTHVLFLHCFYITKKLFRIVIENAVLMHLLSCSFHGFVGRKQDHLIARQLRGLINQRILVIFCIS